jgi:MerR family redox-sensitive transcriptional activator SoxR
MQMFGIGTIARLAGVLTSTIRYYEQIALLPPSERVNSKRRYDGAILQKLNVIRLAQHAGFTIAEIQTLLHEFPSGTPPSERWQAMAGNKIAELDKRIEQIQAMRGLLEQTLQCRCATLDECAGIDESAKGDVSEIKFSCGARSPVAIPLSLSPRQPSDSYKRTQGRKRA